VCVGSCTGLELPNNEHPTASQKCLQVPSWSPDSGVLMHSSSLSSIQREKYRIPSTYLASSVLPPIFPSVLTIRSRPIRIFTTPCILPRYRLPHSRTWRFRLNRLPRPLVRRRDPQVALEDAYHCKQCEYALQISS
jgi:hypothetical protein